MPTIPPTFGARNSGRQDLHFIRRRFQFADIAAFAPGIKIARLPFRAFIHSIMLYKATAFNSATTDTFQLGSTQTGADILAATDIKTAAGFVNATAAAGLGLVVPAEFDLWARYLQSGAAATVGDLTAILAYLPDNDN